MTKTQLKLLVVDDNKHEQIISNHLLANLSDWDCEVDHVFTYQGALEQIARQHHDLCLLSTQSDNHRSLELVEQITGNGLHIPVVMLTDPHDKETPAQALAAGAVDYLVKDEINPTLLTHTIRQALLYKKLKARVTHLQAQVEQYQVEERNLRQSEEQYRMLFNIDVYGMEVCDATGKIIDCNTTYQEMIGYDQANIINKSFSDFMNVSGAKSYRKKWQALQQEGYVEGEFEIEHQNGQTLIFWRRSRAIYDEQGRFNGAVSYVRDITERMVAVEQISTLARALQHSPIPMMVTDIEGDIKYVNLEFSDLTGYEEDELIDQNLRTLTMWRLPSEDTQELWQTITDGNEWHHDVQSVRKDEETYWVAVTITPMFSTKGSITHFIVVLEDITVRREAENLAIDSQRKVGDAVADHITDLTTANEALQLEIAERKRIEESLRRSRSRLKAQYKGFPIPTYSWQRTGDDFMLVDYNDAAEKTIQGQIVNFMGKTVLEVFKDRPQVLADFNRCYERQETIKRESLYRLLTTGESRHFVTTYNFVPPNLVVVHIEDVTETKLIEEQEAEKALQLEQVQTELSQVQTENEHLTEKLRQAEAALNGQQENLADLVDERTHNLKRLNDQLQQQIAERERVEADLREHKARLQAQYNGIPVPTYTWQVVDDDFILIDYNEAAERATSKQIANFMGHSVKEIFRERSLVQEDFNRCYRQKKIIKREAIYRLLTTGKPRYFVTTYNFVQPDLIIVHIQDITEHKEAEVELKKYHDKLSTLATDHAAELIKANHALQKEVDLRKSIEKALQMARKEKEEAQTRLAEEVEHRTAELIEINQKLEAEIAQRKRIEQALRQNESRLKAQYKGIPLPTYSWQRVNGDFVLVDYNDAAEQATQSRIADFKNKTVGQIFKERPQVLADFRRCYEEQTLVKRESLYRLLTTGETRHFVTTYNLVPPDIVIVHIQDVTEYRQVQAESVEQKEQLQNLMHTHQAEIERLEVRLQEEIARQHELEAMLQEARATAEQYQQGINQLVDEQVSEFAAQINALEEQNQQLQAKLTRHTRAEESLRQSRARFKAQYKGIPIPTYSWQRIGEDFVLVDYNQAAEKVTQGRIADFMGKTVKEVFNDRPQTIAAFERCYRQRTTVRLEGFYRLLTTGETRYYVTTYNFVLSNLIIVHIEDITEYKWTKEALQMSKEQVELRCRYTPDLKVSFVNDAYCWYFERHREDIVSQVLPFIFKDDLTRVKNHFALLNPDNPVETIEYRVVKSNDTIRWQQWINRAFFDESGQLLEFQGVGRDITRRKEMQEDQGN